MITDVFSRVNFHHDLSSSLVFFLPRQDADANDSYSHFEFLYISLAHRRSCCTAKATHRYSSFISHHALKGYCHTTLPRLFKSFSYWIPVFAIYLFKLLAAGLIEFHSSQEIRLSRTGHIGILLLSLKSRFHSVVSCGLHGKEKKKARSSFIFHRFKAMKSFPPVPPVEPAVPPLTG